MRAGLGQSAFQPVASASTAHRSSEFPATSGRHGYEEGRHSEPIGTKSGPASRHHPPSCYGLPPWHAWDTGVHLPIPSTTSGALRHPLSSLAALPRREPVHSTQREHNESLSGISPRLLREQSLDPAEREHFNRYLDEQQSLRMMLSLSDRKAFLSSLAAAEREEYRAALALDHLTARRALSEYLTSLPKAESVLPASDCGVGSKHRIPPSRSPSPVANKKSRKSCHRSPSSPSVRETGDQHYGRPGSIDQIASQAQLLPLFRKRFNGVESWTKVYIPRRVAEKNFPVVSAGQECQLEAIGFDGRLSYVTFRRDQRGDFALKHAGSILRGSGMEEGDEVIFCMDVYGRMVLLMQKAGKTQSSSCPRVQRVRSDLSVLFHKKLSSAEVKQHKVYLPKKEAVQHLPNLMAGESCAMSVADVFDNDYSLQLQCRALTIKGETYRQFVLKGMAKLMTKYELQPGDTVFFAVDRSDGALVLCGPNCDTGVST